MWRGDSGDWGRFKSGMFGELVYARFVGETILVVHLREIVLSSPQLVEIEHGESGCFERGWRLGGLR